MSTAPHLAQVPDMPALEFLVHLGQLDVPVWTATTGTNGREVNRPHGWQTMTADGNRERMSVWQPGMAFSGNMGGKVVVLDGDTRNGCNIDQVEAMLMGIGVTVYAAVDTPSGGRHWYLPGHPDLPTIHATTDRDGLVGYPGLEVISYGANVFLPGTQRPKYGGKGYTIRFDRLPQLAETPDPETAENLAAWVAAHRRTQPEPFTPAPPWDGQPPDTRQQRYLDATLANTARRAADAPKGERNTRLFHAAMCLGNYVTGAGLDEASAVAALQAAGAACGLTRDDGAGSVNATIQSGLRVGKTMPRAVPDPTHQQPTELTIERTPQPWDTTPTGSPNSSPGSLTSSTNSTANSTADTTTETSPGSQHARTAVDDSCDDNPNRRHLKLTPASAIKPRPVRWLWDGRLALGTLGILAGREGLGKSTFAYWVAARITHGQLPGHYNNQPRAVLICATEDSWEHTIVPRLIAAGANLDHAYRVEVTNADDIHVGLSLPRDLLALEKAAQQTDAALLLLDPLMSRLGDLDTHRDAEVRQALEPLVAIGDRTGMSIIGLMHHNKSGSVDSLQLVMGSRAFTAVARSVHTIVPHPHDENQRMYGTPKNNLGRTNLPTLTFTVESHAIDTSEGTAWTGRIEWGEEVDESISEIMARSVPPEEKTATDEAGDWLEDYLASQGGHADSVDAKRAGKAAGHTERTLQRAASKLRLKVESGGFPRRTTWTLPVTTEEPQSRLARAGTHNIGATASRGEIFEKTTTTTCGNAVAPVAPSSDAPRARGATAKTAPQVITTHLAGSPARVNLHTGEVLD